ncbi:hypothetical protein JCM10207_008018 [Rhodosporidiobolus poonsookiae]
MDNADAPLSFPPLASLAAAASSSSADNLPPPLTSLPLYNPAAYGGNPFASMAAVSASNGEPSGSGQGGAGYQAAGGADDDDGAAARGVPQKRKSSVGVGSEADDAAGSKAKKQKIPRACDSCRGKKIRCNPIPDSDPLICTYCQKHKRECTWFLPIAETRFKKQREKEEADKATASAAAAAVNLPTAATSATLARQSQYPASTPPVPTPRSNSMSAHHLPLGLGGESRPAGSPDGSSPSNSSAAQRKEPRVIGYTSISHLMHSTSTFPTERLIPVDFKYSQQLSVDERGDGFIRVISAGDADGDGGPVAIQGIEHSDAEKLINYFFTTHSGHFPIVSKADFLGAERPDPLLFNTLCAVSALSHHVAPSILRTIKATIRYHLRDEDMLDSSTIPHIQALLIYAFSMEMEKGAAASKTWNCLGLAIRMAQDLGLHRKLGSERKEQSEADHTELRRRVWGGCLIADRWIAAVFGQPMSIDLADCDTMLPSVFDIRPNLDFNAESRPYLFNSALISLSILLGRILKAVYSPTGIMLLSEKEAKSLVLDLAAWQNGLPPELRFQGPEKSNAEQGYLHLLYLPVRFLITRPFMRISFSLPERFASLSVGTQQWSHVEVEAREAIEWCDRNESALEGWFAGTYAFFICSLIQYHSHIRRRDSASLSTLRLARDCLKRLVVPDGECHVRAKIAEVVHLLYHTAVSVSRWAPEAAEGLSPASSGTTAVTTLNPTVGVRQREQDWHMRFKRDGGYFVTDRRLNDPTGLIRSSASPGSSGPSPRTQNSPLMSSLRSTHVAADAEATAKDGDAAEKKDKEKSADGAEKQDESPAVPSIPPQPPTFPLPPPVASAPPASAAASLPAFSMPAPNPPPDLSYGLADTSLENLSFNPILNYATLTGTAPPSNAETPLGGAPGGSFLGGDGAFDPFGFSGDGTPSTLPDSLFDWNSWQNFADSLGFNANAPASVTGNSAEGVTPKSAGGGENGTA